MKDQRKFFVVVGFAVLAIMALLTSYVIKHPNFVSLSEEKPKTEMQQVREDLGDYIANKLKTEQVGSTLQNISILDPIADAQGSLQIPYTLTYTQGENSTLVQAVAFLKHVENKWRVSKVQTQKETVNFNEVASIKSDSK